MTDCFAVVPPPPRPPRQGYHRPADDTMEPAGLKLARQVVAMRWAIVDIQAAIHDLAVGGHLDHTAEDILTVLADVPACGGRQCGHLSHCACPPMT